MNEILQTINAIDFVLAGLIILLWAYYREINRELKERGNEYLAMAIDVQKKYNAEFNRRTKEGLENLVKG